MPSGRSLRLFLVDGSPTGLITAEIMNWSGHVIAGPRSRSAEVLSREEANRTGVYFLVGDDPKRLGRQLVYIGESDIVGKRLRKHGNDTKMEFWDKLCWVTSKDQNLTKAHVRYLERRLIEIAKDAGRANLLNIAMPDFNRLPESDIADMEYFLIQISLILPVLGFEFLRPRASVTSSAKAEEEQKLSRETAMALMLFDKKHGVEARALEVDGEILVLEGSTARAETSCVANTYKQLRELLISERKLVPAKQSGLLRFTEDVPFKSPSAASAVIFDRNDNGRRSWKLQATGQSLADWQDAQLSETNMSDAAA